MSTTVQLVRQAVDRAKRAVDGNAPTRHLREAVRLRVRAGAETRFAFEQVKANVLQQLTADSPRRAGAEASETVKDLAAALFREAGR